MACEPLATAEQYATAYPSGDLQLEAIQAAVAAAGITLSALMGGAQLSRCTFVLRPYQADCLAWPHMDRRFTPSTGIDPSIALPSPTTAVLEVSVAGSVLDANTDYRVWSNGAALMLSRSATSGVVSWPSSGNTGAATDLMVTVVTGHTPDMLVRNAALQIANDLISSGVVDECGMDPHVISRSAQGVTMQYDASEGHDEKMGAVNRLLARHERYSGPQADIYVPSVGGWTFGEEASDAEPWTP